MHRTQTPARVKRGTRLPGTRRAARDAAAPAALLAPPSPRPSSPLAAAPKASGKRERGRRRRHSGATGSGVQPAGGTAPLAAGAAPAPPAGNKTVADLRTNGKQVCHTGNGPGPTERRFIPTADRNLNWELRVSSPPGTGFPSLGVLPYWETPAPAPTSPVSAVGILAEILTSGRQESVLSHLPLGKRLPCRAGLGGHLLALPPRALPGRLPKQNVGFFPEKKGLNELRPALHESLLAIVPFPQRFWCPGFCGLITACSKWS